MEVNNQIHASLGNCEDSTFALFRDAAKAPLEVGDYVQVTQLYTDFYEKHPRLQTTRATDITVLLNKQLIESQ